MKRFAALFCTALALLGVSCEKDHPGSVDPDAQGYFKVEIKASAAEQPQTVFTVYSEMEYALEQALPENSSRKLKLTRDNENAAKTACLGVVNRYSPTWAYDPVNLILYWSLADDSAKKIMDTYTLGN